MASSSKTKVISLYRMLMRESSKFPSYNYSKYCSVSAIIGSRHIWRRRCYLYPTYALRRVQDGFRDNRHVDNPKTLDCLLTQARETLAVIRRQVSVGQLYAVQRTIVEDRLAKRDF